MADEKKGKENKEQKIMRDPPIIKPKSYCGDGNVLPDGYDKFGTPYECLKKGVGIGFVIDKKKIVELFRELLSIPKTNLDTYDQIESALEDIRRRLKTIQGLNKKSLSKLLNVKENDLLEKLLTLSF